VQPNDSGSVSSFPHLFNCGHRYKVGITIAAVSIVAVYVAIDNVFVSVHASLGNQLQCQLVKLNDWLTARSAVAMQTTSRSFVG
jgi:hypothetical protein